MLMNLTFFDAASIEAGPKKKSFPFTMVSAMPSLERDTAPSGARSPRRLGTGGERSLDHP
jgi:hypothetical protein